MQPPVVVPPSEHPRLACYLAGGGDAQCGGLPESVYGPAAPAPNSLGAGANAASNIPDLGDLPVPPVVGPQVASGDNGVPSNDLGNPVPCATDHTDSSGMSGGTGDCTSCTRAVAIRDLEAQVRFDCGWPGAVSVTREKPHCMVGEVHTNQPDCVGDLHKDGTVNPMKKALGLVSGPVQVVDGTHLMTRLILAAILAAGLSAPVPRADGNAANLDQIVGQVYTQVQRGTATEPPQFQRIAWDNGFPTGRGGTRRIIDADSHLWRSVPGVVEYRAWCSGRLLFGARAAGVLGHQSGILLADIADWPFARDERPVCSRRRRQEVGGAERPTRRRPTRTGFRAGAASESGTLDYGPFTPPPV